jgi:hypothetical protein
VTAETLRVADWVVVPVPEHTAAVALIRAHHYAKGAPNTSTYRHGLYRSDTWPLVGDACGVALWIPPTRRAAESVAGSDWQGVLCLSRLVVVDDVPKNGASYLLGRSMKMIDRKRWPVLLTYADTAHGHTGAIYKATNWERLGETPAGDVWVDADGMQRGRKRGRRTLTVAEMGALGMTRLPSLPKVKFVHRRAA